MPEKMRKKKSKETQKMPWSTAAQSGGCKFLVLET
jgi:hypothetical protein